MHVIVGLLFAISILYGGCQVWQERPVKQSPGVLVSADPVQSEAAVAPAIEKNGYAIKPLARYEIKARVLGKERYRWDEGASLVPFDIAVGWGRMSDSAVLKEIRIWQSGRWYQWRTETIPIPLGEVKNHSANMHLIAADDSVHKQISRLREGQVITLRGYLVEAKRRDGFTWTSSLSREDSGAGACELMWVERLSLD
jgi:hypothetical protein